jgi:hypothetical protein
MGFDTFFKWVEVIWKAKWMSNEEIQKILGSIVWDLEWWDNDWVVLSLVDEGFDENLITKMLNEAVTTTPELTQNTLDNLWENRIDEAVNEYMTTWKIPEWYKVFTKHFNQIWWIMNEIKQIRERWAEADKRWAEADKKIKQINKLLEQIQTIKKQMGSV